jgi:transcription elongation factor GreA
MAARSSLLHLCSMNLQSPMAALDSDRTPAELRLTTQPHLLLTPGEYAAHENELARLRAVRDRELPARLREARTFVTADAVEEIAQIQGDQTVMDARILALEDLLSTATIIEREHVDVVALGSVVEVVYERTGRRATYRVTGTGASAGLTSVSARSPVGQALLGRRAGDVVEALLPGDRVERLEILEVTVVDHHAG